MSISVRCITVFNIFIFHIAVFNISIFYTTVFHINLQLINMELSYLDYLLFCGTLFFKNFNNNNIILKSRSMKIPNLYIKSLIYEIKTSSTHLQI
jgi:hypothetical protein